MAAISGRDVLRIARNTRKEYGLAGSLRIARLAYERRDVLANPLENPRRETR